MLDFQREEDLKSMKLQPIVHWAGGKRRILPELLKRVPQKYGTYFEPFVGGGALLFALKPANAFVSDSNVNLITLYNVIKEQPQLFANAVKRINASAVREVQARGSMKSVYHHFRDKYNSFDNNVWTKNRVLVSALFVWLNRYCFNGLYRVNKRGEFNTAFGSRDYVDFTEILENVEDLSSYLSSCVTMQCCDFESACSKVQQGDFVYFDPPYVSITESSDFRQYTKDGFTLSDQCRLAECAMQLAARGAYVLLSNSDTPAVRNLYSFLNIETITAPRTISGKASSRKPVSELLISNYTV